MIRVRTMVVRALAMAVLIVSALAPRAWAAEDEIRIGSVWGLTGPAAGTS